MRVELEWLALEVVAGLPPAGRTELRLLMNDLVRQPDAWPTVGGDEVADFFGVRCWVSVVAYRGVLEVRDVGWCG